jgi:hypothetical protein
MLAGAPELSGKHRVDLVFTDVLLRAAALVWTLRAKSLGGS